MGLRTGADMLIIAGGAPLQMQKDFPTREAADKDVEDYTAKEMATLDANDLLYQVDGLARLRSERRALAKIKAPMMWINSADDFINPPELGIAETEVKKIKHADVRADPGEPQTHGHGTHTWAAVWKDYMAELLKETERKVEIASATKAMNGARDDRLQIVAATIVAVFAFLLCDCRDKHRRNGRANRLCRTG